MGWLPSRTNAAVHTPAPWDSGLPAIWATPWASAVWFAGAMGLLDDAIREHLELKRLSGADPGDMARAEQDALGPVRREKESEHDEQTDTQLDNHSSSHGSFFSAPEPTVHTGVSAPDHSGQETVEINMEAELKRGIDVEYERNAPNDVRATLIEHPTYAQTDNEESIQWEHPSGRLGEREGAVMPGSDVEDTLGETPDFLRDTPE